MANSRLFDFKHHKVWRILSLVAAGVTSLFGIGIAYAVFRHGVIGFNNIPIALRSILFVGITGGVFVLAILWLRIALKHTRFHRFLTFSSFSMHFLLILILANVGIYTAIRYIVIRAAENNCFTRDQLANACSTDNRCYYISSNKVYEKGTCGLPHNCSSGQSDCHPCGSDISAKLPSSHTGPLADFYLLANLKGYLAGEAPECPAASPSPTPEPSPNPSPSPTPTPAPENPTPTPPTNPSPTPNQQTTPVPSPTPPTGGTKVVLPTSKPTPKTTPATAISDESLFDEPEASPLAQIDTSASSATGFAGLLPDTAISPARPAPIQNSSPSPASSISEAGKRAFTLISLVLAWFGAGSVFITIIIWIGMAIWCKFARKKR